MLEPAVPLLLCALGTVSVSTVSMGTVSMGSASIGGVHARLLAYGLVAVAGLLGLAGLAGWQNGAAVATRAVVLTAIAFSLPLVDRSLVPHVLQWWYAIIAVYPLVLTRFAARTSVGIGAALAAQYWVGTVTPHVTLTGWLLRSVVVMAIGVIVARSGDAYRSARDTARRRQVAAEAAERELHHANTHDHLTGMPNRSSLELFLDVALHGRRASGDHEVALLLLDLDRFKNVNETLGHLAGDRLLREVAERLTSALGPDQHVARLGGDEFAVVCAPTSLAEAELASRRLVAQFERPIELNGAPYTIGLSIGVAVSGNGIETRADLLRCADAAMYAAKRSGRGRSVTFDDAMSEDVAANLAVEQRLRQAITRGDATGDTLHPDAITAVFQPVVDLNTGQVVGAEALGRWQLDGRPVSPLRFVPLAEELGLGRGLAMVVARQSVRAMAAWRRAGLHDVKSIAVNISAHDLLTPGLAEEIAGLVADAGLPAGAITLEITERDVVDDVERTRAALEHLRQYGITVAVDDFGTGFSSLAYLARLPLQVLKIDREFVANLHGDDTIARTVVSLARSFGMETIAEGIETPEQLDALRELGVECGQGWHLGRPALAGDFVEAVRSWSTTTV